MSLLDSICLVGGRISVSERIEDSALNHQFEGTKLISMYSGGTYDRGARAWRARDVRTVTDG